MSRLNKRNREARRQLAEKLVNLPGCCTSKYEIAYRRAAYYALFQKPAGVSKRTLGKQSALMFSKLINSSNTAKTGLIKDWWT